MPARLQPTAPTATAAILVGDPGRALLLAQAVLAEPKMSNHARGLWGYTGRTPAGAELTVQATGMGGPSAALVLTDLVELGLRRAVRIGTCSAIEPELGPGDPLLVIEAHTWSGGGEGKSALPDPRLTARLRKELGGQARPAIVASLDDLHRRDRSTPAPYADSADAADMQTATLLAAAAPLGVAIAAALIVSEDTRGKRAGDESLAAAAKLVGTVAATVLST